MALTGARGFDLIVEMLANVNLDNDLGLLWDWVGGSELGAPGRTVASLGLRTALPLTGRLSWWYNTRPSAWHARPARPLTWPALLIMIFAPSAW